jgi:hypothetical protein
MGAGTGRPSAERLGGTGFQPVAEDAENDIPWCNVNSLAEETPQGKLPSSHNAVDDVSPAASGLERPPARKGGVAVP